MNVYDPQHVNIVLQSPNEGRGTVNQLLVDVDSNV